METNFKKREKIAILGSTGSIGTQALDVVRCMGLQVTALCANRRIDLLEAQAREFRPQMVAVMDEKAAAELKIRLADTDIRVRQGMDGFIEAATLPQNDVTLNSVVGMVGLLPTLAVIDAGIDLALANKETLVAGGQLVMRAARARGVPILPVDSEHSAIFQCLQGSPGAHAFKRILLTASGGPFFGKKREELLDVTPEQALKHPNWNMGAKITIDSATLMNKGLEVIEAAWLFDRTVDEIEVVVQRESIIHSAVEFCDNSVIAQLGTPDMRIPIQYAISYPDRVPSPAEPLDLFKVGRLTFYRPDTETFICLAACQEAMRRGGLAPAAANGANEMAVALFLQKKIGFLDIGRFVWEAMDRQPSVTDYTVEDVLACDKAAREYVLSAAGKL